jgi:hypothetical protein
MDDGKRIDNFAYNVEFGETIDLGWGFAIVREDYTVIRTCKACLATAISHMDPATGKVQPAPILHGRNCPVEARLGNSPATS